uniref:Huntingtin interacting protein 1 related b n=1 Tax=Astyanax mexicanus TaxID=7994 RepID=A0A8B9L5H1_ASTMX
IISKAINTSETPVKEKHARRIILGTHREKGAYTFWSYAIGLPLSSSAILSWKFCHVLHKVLRDGHTNSLQDCMRHHSNISEIGQLWGNIRDRYGYGQLVAQYAKLLCSKMEFHNKHPEIRANLEASDEVLERTAGTDINNVFQLTVEVFDYMDVELRLAESVLRQLNTSIAISTLTAGQCKLAPLIQVIQDCSHLYHYTVKLLFKLHACLPPDTLQGHRERFHDQFHSLKTFFNKARDMMYFKRLIQIPRLPDSPPNFLRASALAEHVKPMVVIPDEEEPEEQEEDEPEPLIDVDIFDQAFGPPNDGFDDRDLQIESLKREIEALRTELEKIKAEAQRYITQLKSQINSLEAELEEQRVQKQRALVENEQLRMELEATRRRNAEHESIQSTFVEADKRAQATELRYNKLKEKHAELVANHAELLRKVFNFHTFIAHLIHLKHFLFQLEEQKFEMDKLRRDLEEKIVEIQRMKGTLQTCEKVSMTSLQVEKERLMRCDEVILSEALKQIISARVCLQQSHEKQLQQRMLEEQFALLQGTVSEAEMIIQDAVAKLDDPLHIRCTSSPDYLVSRAEDYKLSTMLSSVSVLSSDAGALLRALTQFSHLAADTIINGSATAHMAPTDNADRLTENCRGCATQSLHFLQELKSKDSLKGADPSSIRVMVQKILRIAQDLRPKGMDVGKEELGDMVDKEMAATSAAIEEAVRRIDVSLRTGAASAIRLLVLASTDLQKEIVESGRGAATVREFYARNSRWTEGLISAAKAVGWGATQMVDSADKVVLHTGKYEELIVCSHEIAASTAQLVAASKVKADRGSKKLSSLQQASRHVNEMAANVVASTKTGQEQIEDKDTMDFSGMSLIKLKKEEMESQVKVLELESMLENERLRLGELRKKHYEIAGVPLEQIAQDNGLRAPSPTAPFSPRPSKPALMKKPALAQKPNVPPKTMVNLQRFT